ncbi:DUF4129 domain-containing protein [Nocardia takedensis]|uniref:DUF4129 domain-containing protein n=1 Tax=Nocardia takedensis TaxID=259390 RepID=UPI00030E4E72|nr:DUF4129 domain-containing protein [Nocardia takedensis]
MIVLITLVVCAVIALRGYVPGAAEHGPPTEVPSAVAVALMPVLFTVSVVILVAGVIASRHRLPLAMPETERDDDVTSWQFGRIGLVVLVAVTVLAILAALASLAYVVLDATPRDYPPPPAAATPTPTATTDQPAADPGDPVPAEGLEGLALVVTIGAAGVLVAVGLIGMGSVVYMARKPVAAEEEQAAEAAPAVVDSLVIAAEMGLAAMNAPGQEPRAAIIACYVAMERGLAFDRAAAPLISDTPTEVLARAFEHGALHDASARELVALFEEARFSPHAMLEWQRLRAEQLLRVVLADLQSKQSAANQGAEVGV